MGNLHDLDVLGSMRVVITNAFRSAEYGSQAKDENYGVHHSVTKRGKKLVDV